MYFDGEMLEKIPNFWLLCREYSARQAALLIAGVDPSGKVGANCEQWKEHERPTGYEAIKQALKVALQNEEIKGSFVPIFTYWNNEQQDQIPGSFDVVDSKVERDSLVSWLRMQGVVTGFFFQVAESPTGPGYLDPKHPRYAQKLAAAVSAWIAVTDPKGKTPKQALDKWLREHAAEFGMVNDDGNPVEAAVSDCSKLANWEPGGGAPKTPGG